MNTYHGWEAVPPHLKTKTALKSEGLRLARGQEHVAYCQTRYGRKTNIYKLYNKYDAIPAKPPTEKQLAAIAKAQAASLEKRTCHRCGYVEELSRNYRDKIRVINNVCPHCDLLYEIEDAHDDAIDWASAILADDKAIILDCQTVNLESEIIELAMINMQGDVLFLQRFKPILPIHEEALGIHGITTEMLQNEPAFAQFEVEIRTLLSGASKMIMYALDHDKACLDRTCKLHEIERFKFDGECAMEKYAEFLGNYSDWYENYRLYPLGGDHTSLGNCKATLATLREMARGEKFSNEE